MPASRNNKTVPLKGPTATATPNVGRKAAVANPCVDRFPFPQYASVLGVHLLLIWFTALCLPQTTRFFAPLAVRETDRPQSEFMEALTANPLMTSGWISMGIVLLQVWWAGWVRKWSFEQTVKGSETEIKLERMRLGSSSIMRCRDATVFTLCAALTGHVVLVMFGAPFTTHILETGLLAFVVAILTTFTPAFVLGPPLASDNSSLINRLAWTRLFAELTPKTAIEFVMVYPTVGTFIGAWLGAIPIALDWDRPWQAWPLTPLFGSIAGYSIGSLLAFVLSTARRLAPHQIQSQPSKFKSR